MLPYLSQILKIIKISWVNEQMVLLLFSKKLRPRPRHPRRHPTPVSMPPFWNSTSHCLYRALLFHWNSFLNSCVPPKFLDSGVCVPPVSDPHPTLLPCPLVCPKLATLGNKYQWPPILAVLNAKVAGFCSQKKTFKFQLRCLWHGLGESAHPAAVTQGHVRAPERTGPCLLPTVAGFLRAQHTGAHGTVEHGTVWILPCSHHESLLHKVSEEKVL